jgi:uncharacterized protein YjeT (DUF2065 family)
MNISIVIKIIGIVCVLLGIVYIVKPNVMKYLMQFFKQGKRLYFAGLIRFALAIIFLLGARKCGVPRVIVALGILFIISGLLIFMVRLEKLKSMIDWYQNQSLVLLRFIALIGLALGAIIIYSA